MNITEGNSGGKAMVGRKEECLVLEDAVNSGRPEFLALYGRRRVGKTYLVKEYFKDSFSFYATGVHGCNTRQQLKIFKEALVKYGDATQTVPKDWFEAFSRLEVLLQDKKTVRDYKSGRRVVFLDELPWMDTPRSDFKSALDYFWNSWGSSQKDLLLIICGSATSWIIDNVVKDTGGFYNRLTRQIRLMPFSLGECEQLLIANGLQMTRKQIIECYMILGGIPYYLNYLRSGLSLAQNIDILFFHENSPLKYEFKQLFSALFRHSDNYIAVVEKLAGQKGGMTRTELVKSKDIGGGKELTRCLEDLEQCGFIRKYHDFTRSSNSCVFQLVDPLCLFYLTFLRDGKIGSWMDYIGTPGYYNWCGLAFEKVGIQHIEQIKKALGISGVSCNCFAWRSKKTIPGAQIDLLIDRKDDVINVCEMKYSTEEYSIDADVAKDLIHKAEVLRMESRTKKAIWITMISFSGLKKNEHYNSVQSMISGDELFD